MLVAALLGSGCGGAHIENGVYRSSKGYWITIPGPDWAPDVDGRSDLQLRRAADGAAMLVNATCDAGVSHRRLDVLTRQVLVGLRDRHVLERDEVPVAGHPAAHAVLDGRMSPAGAVRVEVYVVKAPRCVFDLIYAAPPSTFERGQSDFHRFVDSFVEQ
jgi:hypothetical protein